MSPTIQECFAKIYELEQLVHPSGVSSADIMFRAPVLCVANKRRIPSVPEVFLRHWLCSWRPPAHSLKNCCNLSALVPRWVSVDFPECVYRIWHCFWAEDVLYANWRRNDNARLEVQFWIAMLLTLLQLSQGGCCAKIVLQMFSGVFLMRVNQPVLQSHVVHISFSISVRTSAKHCKRPFVC